MTLYDDAGSMGFGELNGMIGSEYLRRAADAATETMLWADAYDADTGSSEDISESFAPVSHTDVPDNDSWEQLEGLLQDERVAEIIDRREITPETFGHNFHLSRNGHGAGFWDLGWEDDGTYLHEMSKPSGTAGVAFRRDADGYITDLYFHG